MQRPLHLRYSDDEGPSANKQPYIPTYGGNTQGSPTAEAPPQGMAGYQPVYFYPTAAPPSSSYEGTNLSVITTLLFPFDSNMICSSVPLRSFPASLQIHRSLLPSHTTPHPDTPADRQLPMEMVVAFPPLVLTRLQVVAPVTVITTKLSTKHQSTTSQPLPSHPLLQNDASLSLAMRGIRGGTLIPRLHPSSVLLHLSRGREPRGTEDTPRETP